MTRVVTVSSRDAARAIVPVWTVQALVANTKDILQMLLADKLGQ